VLAVNERNAIGIDYDEAMKKIDERFSKNNIEQEN
jgi:hypothetical protein